jgi:SAM-dependent methyltransferase
MEDNGAMPDETRRSRSFGSVAELYERLRPDYPAAALDAVLGAVLGGAARRVADVGAGTGKLTRALVRRGLSVIAVEPDGVMRAVLSDAVPGADARGGTGEALPIGDHEVDAVIFGQSWHWVDSERAAREATRVLTPGGVLAMLWNLTDDRVPWVAELDRITANPAGVTKFPADLPALAGFGAPERVEVPWSQTLTPGELVDLTRTWSMVNTLPDAERERVIGEVGRLVDTHPELAGRERLDFPYVCTTRIFRRAPAPAG